MRKTAKELLKDFDEEYGKLPIVEIIELLDYSLYEQTYENEKIKQAFNGVALELFWPRIKAIIEGSRWRTFDEEPKPGHIAIVNTVGSVYSFVVKEEVRYNWRSEKKSGAMWKPVGPLPKNKETKI